MFNLVDKRKDTCTIYKSGIIDAARCVIAGKDDRIAKIAKAELDDMFLTMTDVFERKELVRMNYLKHKQSDYLDFKDINDFKVWLIRNQGADSFYMVLEQLKLFCKRNKKELPSISIVFGNHYTDTIYNTDMYFDNTYDREWFLDEQVKKVIKDVDKSEVIDPFVIRSPVFGTMIPEKLSGGVKTLILLYKNPNLVLNVSTCGDNCAKWIKRFSKEKFFLINLRHAMRFPNDKIDAYIVNGGEIIHSMDDLYICADKYCRS